VTTPVLPKTIGTQSVLTELGLALPGTFLHVDTWIFDLDNTLYPHHSRIWPQVDERITLFLSDYFGIDGISARALQKYYYHRYGTSLKGLMTEHGLDAKAFLDFAHDIDLSSLAADPDLGQAIAALPGRKLIMTNGSTPHATRITQKLGIFELFEGIFDISDAGFVPKPERATYDLFVRSHGITPSRAAMFEDIEKNLRVPHDLGMKTVLVVPATTDPYRELHEQVATQAAYVDAQTSNLAAFLANLSPQ
jgi:putative hydrolase of the HAD superfamily